MRAKNKVALAVELSISANIIVFEIRLDYLHLSAHIIGLKLRLDCISAQIIV